MMMHVVRTKEGRLFLFRGVQIREDLPEGSKDGFTPSRKGNNDPPFTASRKTNAIHAPLPRTILDVKPLQK
jgi:hypothetical protein